MAKTPLIQRMEKAGAPKTWISEVRKIQAALAKCEQSRTEYIDIIDVLAQQLEREEEEIAEFERRKR